MRLIVINVWSWATVSLFNPFSPFILNYSDYILPPVSLVERYRNNLENLNAVFSSSLESDLSQANKLPPILYQRRRALIQKLIRNFPEAATWSILQNKGFLKFCRFRRETSVLESLFKTLEVLVLIKKRLPHRCFPGKICEIFKNTYFEEHLRPTPSGFHFKKLWSTRLKFLEFFKQRENYRNILPELVIK